MRVPQKYWRIPFDEELKWSFLYHSIKRALAVVLLLVPFSGYADAITCEVLNDGNVRVLMKTPHPEHALVNRPDNTVVWLQTSPEFVHHQVDNFGALKEWLITPESKGTVWVDGKAQIQPVIHGSGRYHLYIADNLETEQENIRFIECYFEVQGNGAVAGAASKNPRMRELNPYAWNALPIETVIEDFQESDGIFSSFICDEIQRRLVSNPLGSLRALREVGKGPRRYAFRICLSPEDGVMAGLLEGIRHYANEYPELVDEILTAAGED